MQYFDVVVIGGGPAGCATALSLKREAPSKSVAILESSGNNAVRIGETLPPNIDRLLAHLGVWRPFLDSGPLEAYGTRACWGSDAVVENEFIFQKQGRGWHLDRGAFDRMLASEAVRAGIQLMSRTSVVAHRRTSENWSLAVHRPGSVFSIDCAFVVDATGRKSAFAVQQGAKHITYDRLFGCFLFFAAGRIPPDSYTLVEACERGWTYSAALPDGRLVAAFLSDADIFRRVDLCSPNAWTTFLEHTPETRKRLQGMLPSSAPVIRSASSQQLNMAAGDGWIAVGDAASTFDPLSSHGIYKALRSGIFASYTILDTLKTNGSNNTTKYQQFIRDEFNEYLDIRATYYAQEQRWPEAPFWKRRHEHITLDPARMLQASANGPSRSGTQLTPAEVKLMQDVCSQPSPAHEVVREFVSRSPRIIPHHRVVLAVQHLLETGAILECT